MRRLLSILALVTLADPGAVFAAEVSATIKTFQYQPKEIVAHPGDTVVVLNEDGIEHSLTADDAGDSGPLFDTGLFKKGEERSFVAPGPGTYAFRCARHASMKGTLKVE